MLADTYTQTFVVSERTSYSLKSVDCERDMGLVEQSKIKVRMNGWRIGGWVSCGDLMCGLFDTIRRTNELADSFFKYA